MKAILIDPLEGSIRKVKFKNGNDIRGYLQCSIFSGVGFTYDKKMGTVYHDDEALFVRPLLFFYIPELYPMPLPGRGLIAGADEDGETVNIPNKLEHNLLNGVASVSFPTFDEVTVIEQNLMNGVGYGG
tara:strand:+ start:268 stop:654 length:387 start_codon:yes stop_codon:yes gene_type:complete